MATPPTPWTIGETIAGSARRHAERAAVILAGETFADSTQARVLKQRIAAALAEVERETREAAARVAESHAARPLGDLTDPRFENGLTSSRP